MVQAGRGSPLPHESPDPVGVRGKVRPQDLDSDQLIQSAVPGEVDHPHATLSQLLFDNALADHLVDQ